ncbi:MAG TPA: iron-containing redox enzyme family protein [Chloroflexota bacterium]|nr:iron-containing redox enzyme family protein [Chloroflexota bacterium]
MSSFARGLIEESRTIHPFLHHPLYHDIWAGKLSPDQVRVVVRQQGAFSLDTIRHGALRLAHAGGTFPTREELELQRALIPTIVEEAGQDTVGGTQTAHPLLFVRFAGALGIAEDDLFHTSYLPEIVIEKSELFALQVASTLEALCGGAIATEAINHEHSGRMAEAYQRHYHVSEHDVAFYAVHAGGIEEEHGARGVEIVDRLIRDDSDRDRARLAMLRAIAARRTAADAMYRAIQPSN